MTTDNKLRISIKYGEIEAKYTISEKKSPEVFSKMQKIIDPLGMITESQLQNRVQHTRLNQVLF